MFKILELVTVDVYGRAVYLQSEKYDNFHLKWLWIFVVYIMVFTVCMTNVSFLI